MTYRLRKSELEQNLQKAMTEPMETAGPNEGGVELQARHTRVTVNYKYMYITGITN